MSDLSPVQVHRLSSFYLSLVLSFSLFVLGISKAYLGYIMGISWVYLGLVFGIHLAHLVCRFLAFVSLLLIYKKKGLSSKAL